MIDELSDVELYELIKCQNEEAYNFLFFRYEHLSKLIIAPLITRFHFLNLDYDELKQESRIILDFIIRTFDYSKGNFFNYWYNVTYRHLKCEVRKYLSKSNQYTRTISDMDKDNFFNENLFISVTDIANEYSIKEMTENINAIRKEYLSQEQDTILEMVVDGYTYKEISFKLGISTKSVDNKLYCIRREIKKRLGIA